jgi:hypothetical protein
VDGLSCSPAPNKYLHIGELGVDRVISDALHIGHRKGVRHMKISFDTLLGGYSLYRLITYRGRQVWQLISNHPTYEAAKLAESIYYEFHMKRSA